MEGLSTYIAARPHLRAFVETFDAQMGDVAIGDILLYIIDNAPASALYFLAEQFDVTGYGGWILCNTDAERRDLLRNAVELQKLKGTVAAIRRALALTGFPLFNVNENLNLQKFYDGSLNFSGSIVYGDGAHWAYFRIVYNLLTYPTLTAQDITNITEVVNRYKNVRSVLYELAAGVQINESLNVSDAVTIDAGMTVGSGISSYYNGSLLYAGAATYGDLSDNVNVVVSLSPEAQWAQDSLDEYLLINEHVDAAGNDIQGRTLTSDKKQYIFNRLVDTLAPRFFGSGATIVTRSSAEMALSMFYFQRAAGDIFQSSVLTQPGSDLLFVSETTVADDTGFPSHNSSVTSGGYGSLVISKRITGYWEEIERWSLSAFRDANTFAEVAGFFQTIIPVLSAPNHTSAFGFQTGEFVGSIADMLKTFTNFNSFGNIGGISIFISGRFSPSPITSISLDFIERCTNGLEVRDLALQEAELKGIIDVIHNIRFSLTSGRVYHFQDNHGSAAVAADPVYGGPGGILDQIAADGSVTVVI